MKNEKDNILENESVKAFGNRVRFLRESKGLSMQALADLCNVEYSQISRIELGKIATSISMAFVIARVLEVRPKELFDF